MPNYKNVKKALGRWFSWPWYPIAFGVYPVLALLAQNAGEVKPEAGWRPLLVSLGLALSLVGIWGLILRTHQRVAFLSTLWLALICYYGHVYLLVPGKWTTFALTPSLLGEWLV